MVGFMKSDLTVAIQNATKEWVYNVADPICYIDINSGSCGEFAHYVVSMLPKNSGVVLASTKTFMEEVGLEHYQSTNNELSEIKFSNHAWLIFDGSHFDIERPEGTDQPINLPYFQREIEMYISGMSEAEFINFIVTENSGLDSKLRFIG
jgi:hypothetical protein